MKKYLFACFFPLLITSNLVAQVNTKSILQLHLFPLTALEIDGGIRAGAELFLSPKFSLVADYNHLIDALDKDAARTNLKGYAIRLEPRFYSHIKFLSSGNQYIAIQFLYKSKTWKFKNDTISPNLEKYVISIKHGERLFFNKNFGIEMYYGLGAGIRNNKIAFGEGFTRNNAGTFFTPNLLLGASVFYAF